MRVADGRAQTASKARASLEETLARCRGEGRELGADDVSPNAWPRLASCRAVRRGKRLSPLAPWRRAGRPWNEDSCYATRRLPARGGSRAGGCSPRGPAASRTSPGVSALCGGRRETTTPSDCASRAQTAPCTAACYAAPAGCFVSTVCSCRFQPGGSPTGAAPLLLGGCTLAQGVAGHNAGSPGGSCVFFAASV